MRISRTVQWIRETARLPAVGLAARARGSGADGHLREHRRPLAAATDRRTRAAREPGSNGGSRPPSAMALRLPALTRRHGHPHACVDGRACGPPRHARRRRLPPRERLLLGGVAAAFPDVDFIGFLVDPLRFLAYWHQGPTHSLLLLPLWAVLLGALFCGVHEALAGVRRSGCGQQPGAGLAHRAGRDHRLRHAGALSAVRPAREPGHDVRHRPAVHRDRRHRAWRRVCAAAGAASRRSGCCCSVLVCGRAGALLRVQALRRSGARRRAARPSSTAPVDAMPQPFSPFNWKLVATQGDGLPGRSSSISSATRRWCRPGPAWRAGSAMARAYCRPSGCSGSAGIASATSRQVRELAQHAVGTAGFRGVPPLRGPPGAVRAWMMADAHRCVWFTDLRYDLPALPDTFRYGYCQDPPGAPWRLFRFGTSAPTRGSGSTRLEMPRQPASGSCRCSLGASRSEPSRRSG